MSTNGRSAPIRLALVNDYDVIVAGVARMLDPYSDRVVVDEMDTNEPIHDLVDIALYDTFAQPESDADRVRVLLDNHRARRVAVYTWNLHQELLDSARRHGVHGYLSKALPARDLVAALEAIHDGETVFAAAPAKRNRRQSGLDWPGRGEGLSDREAEILALISQGKNNAEIAALTYLSDNTIKSYVRGLYRKIDVASRTQAVLWGIAHGFNPDHHRIDRWRNEP
jgi:DNA-binding NarL/FixJ family response regulator